MRLAEKKLYLPLCGGMPQPRSEDCLQHRSNCYDQTGEQRITKTNPEGKTHIYQPRYKKESVLKRLINQNMVGFVNQFGEEALIAFVDGLGDISKETRRKLILKLRENE